MRRLFLPPLALPALFWMSVPGYAFDALSTSKISGRIPAVDCAPDAPGIAVNGADGKLFYCDGAGQRTATLLNALPSGRRAVEQGQADDLTVGGVPLSTIITRPGGKITLTPDAFLGDSSAATATILGGASPRSLAARFGERPSVIDFRVDMTGVTDSTVAFAAALNSGRPINAPCGTIRLVSRVIVTAKAQFVGSGICTMLKFDAPAGSPEVPMLDLLPSAAGSTFENFAFDHQAPTKGYTDPVIYNGNLIVGSAILIQSDDTRFSKVTGYNGSDNCIAVAQLNATNPSNANPGQPRRYALDNIRTFNCGKNRFKAGSGIDIGSGAHGTVNDLVDVGSSGAFGLDIGAGAQGVFSNMTGIDTTYDASVPKLRGQTFYIGSSDSIFTNLVSIGSKDRCMWLDGFGTNTVINGFVCKAPANEGFFTKVDEATILGLEVNSAGYGKAAGTVDAIVMDTSAKAATGLRFISPVVKSEFNTMRYGFNQIGGNAVTGYAIGADLSGGVTATNGVSATFGMVDGSALGGGWKPYTPTVACQKGGGTLATTSASGSYRLVGRTVEFQANATITDKGSCTFAPVVGLPFAAKDRVSFSGIESNLTGALLGGAADGGGATVTLKKADSSSPIANGAVLTFGGTYQRQ